VKKCPYCRARNDNDAPVCKDCFSPLTRAEVIPDPPKPKKKSKPRKAPEYVRLYHGPLVKRSTYNWIQNKNREAGRNTLLVIGFMILIAALAQCS
jgi:hypothetical protein